MNNNEPVLISLFTWENGKFKEFYSRIFINASNIPALQGLGLHSLFRGQSSTVRHGLISFLTADSIWPLYSSSVGWWQPQGKKLYLILDGLYFQGSLFWILSDHSENLVKGSRICHSGTAIILRWRHLRINSCKKLFLNSPYLPKNGASLKNPTVINPLHGTFIGREDWLLSLWMTSKHWDEKSP